MDKSKVSMALALFVAMALAIENTTENDVVETRQINYRKCDRSFFEREFLISSPNYPEPYSSDLDCAFTVQRAPDACQLLLRVQDFQLEQSEGCSADYLAVQEQRFCGRLAPMTIFRFSFTTETIVIRFHSNAFGVAIGFVVVGKQETCGEAIGPFPAPGPLPRPSPFGCDGVYDQPEFYISSPLYPRPYPDNVQCDYVVKKSSVEVCALVVEIEYLDLEVTHQCLDEYLELNNQKYCYNPQLFSPNLNFDSETLNIRFKCGANLRQRQGFRLRIRQRECHSHPEPLPPPIIPTPRPLPPPIIPTPRPLPPPIIPIPRPLPVPCQRTFTEPQFELLWPPTIEFERQIECTYIVVKSTANICYVAFTFIEFNFELSSQAQCTLDYMQIADERLCMRSIQGTTRMYAFKEEQMVIKLFSQSPLNRLKIQVQQQPCRPQPQPYWPQPRPQPQPYFPPNYCIGCPNQGPNTFGAQTFSVRSPGFPANYANGLDCYYTVLKASLTTCQLVVQFQLFDVELSQDCAKDALTFDGQLALCGFRQPGFTRTFNFNADQMLIRFKTDFLSGGRGFVMDVWQVDCFRPRPPIPPPQPFGPCVKKRKCIGKCKTPCYDVIGQTESSFDGAVYKRQAVDNATVTL